MSGESQSSRGERWCSVQLRIDRCLSRVHRPQPTIGREGLYVAAHPPFDWIFLIADPSCRRVTLAPRRTMKVLPRDDRLSHITKWPRLRSTEFILDELAPRAHHPIVVEGENDREAKVLRPLDQRGRQMAEVTDVDHVRMRPPGDPFKPVIHLRMTKPISTPRHVDEI